ncbi:sn-glycerol-3-phosphate ABC transporter ATP-binding protein UgpC [Pseudooceanicola sp. 216_PA32_1]|uniref:sn-glycerol-3-phosphate ABC transporter ATP-binding protein UgpC n=1 Tax=Pseudooceanicola pacificus TaxID=2676438 RepID=A0A844WCP2_9RHOB|nr:sn-glycerol-3-phosphate ABC transporter ATP-binding protein UgpC [Pseudooceanicola pacificus]MWB79173.1 sn-glycerol-3-phosphate ABC transporter ATP-binding protein UgpC [Pseudooceanicola pacificus]
MTGIELTGIRKRFGETEVVKDLDLSIAEREFLVILGPSGCGKSTLLRMIAGLEDVTQGRIAIGAQDVTWTQPGQRGCAMVFQNYALYPHMSVAGNMAYGLKVAGVPRRERSERVARIAATLELGALLDRKPHELSGGQRQRVAMGRAMIRSPRVFLFDEPLSNLDAKLRAQLRLEIKRLHRDLGTTSIFVTHDQLEAMTMADRMVVMNAGRIEQVGTPQEIYRQPATRFVAGFIGAPAINMFPALIDEDGRAMAPGGWYPCPDAVWALAPGTAVELGVRPADVVAAASDACRPSFTPDISEDVGTEVHLHAHGAGFDLTLSVPAGAPLPTRSFAISFPSGVAHCFLKENGQRAALRHSIPERTEATWPETSLSSI